MTMFETILQAADAVKKVKEEVAIPVFEPIKEINPSLDFTDDSFYLGLMLRVRTSDKLFVLPYWITESGFKTLDELIDDEIYIKSAEMFDQINLSNFLLEKIYNMPQKEGVKQPLMNEYNDMKKDPEGRGEIRNFLKSYFSDVLKSCIEFHKSLIKSRPYSGQILANNEVLTILTIINDKSIIDPSIINRLIFHSLLTKYKHYVELEEKDLKLLVLFTMATYFYPLFDAFPYIYLTGIKRSGKSTILKVLSQVCFNAITSFSISSASAFRIINNSRPTLLIDETDALAHSENLPELRAILLSAYKKGGSVYRVQQVSKDIKSFRPYRYQDIYCPIVLANITGLEDVLEDRTILIVCQRALKKEYSQRRIWIDRDPEWQLLRDLLYLNMFMNWREIKAAYEQLENAWNLSNREWELYQPLLTIAKFVSDEIFAEMVAHFELKSQQKQIEDIAERAETAVVLALQAIVVRDEWYPFKMIFDAVLAELGYEEAPKWLTRQKIGRVLRKLGFITKRIASGRQLEYYITKSQLQLAATRLGISSAAQPTDDAALKDWILAQFNNGVKLTYFELEQAFMRANNISDPTDERLDELHKAFVALKEQNKIVLHQIVAKGELYGL